MILASTPTQGGSSMDQYMHIGQFVGCAYSALPYLVWLSLSLFLCVTATVLRNNTAVTGFVPVGGYNYYSFLTSDTQVTEIRVIPDRGQVYLYASYLYEMPSPAAGFEWASANAGPNSILLTPRTPGYQNGYLYISVFGQSTSNYKLLVTAYNTV
jgi:hypothetical protein